jgi:hypothetical protein
MPRVIKVFLLLVLAGSAVLTSAYIYGIATLRHLHVRGQLDRTNWVVRTCGSQDSYRVIMTSGQWAKLLDYQKQFNVLAADPLMIEFDGTTIPPKWPWSAHETIGIDSSMHFQRGTCQ